MIFEFEKYMSGLAINERTITDEVVKRRNERSILGCLLEIESMLKGEYKPRGTEIITLEMKMEELSILTASFWVYQNDLTNSSGSCGEMFARLVGAGIMSDFPEIWERREQNTAKVEDGKTIVRVSRLTEVEEGQGSVWVGVEFRYDEEMVRKRKDQVEEELRLIKDYYKQNRKSLLRDFD